MTKELDREIINHTSSLRDQFLDMRALNSNLQSLETIIEVDTRFLEKPRILEELSSNEKINLDNDIIYFNKQIKDAKTYISKIQTEIDNFPEAPELPPSQPLIKISGVIEQLTVKNVIGYFNAEEYRTAVYVRTNNGERKKYKCTYVSGKISGKTFSGWLGKTNIQLGDQVEMAVMPQGEQYKMYAVANPLQRTISTTIGCSAGHANYSMRLSMTAMTTVFMSIAIIVILFSLDKGIEYALKVLAICGVISVVSGFFIYKGVVKDTRATSDLFERICAALEIPNGEHLILDTLTKDKINQMKYSGEWINPDDEKIPMPRTELKYCDDYFFYY
jgi:hypothetical protein